MKGGIVPLEDAARWLVAGIKRHLGIYSPSLMVTGERGVSASDVQEAIDQAQRICYTCKNWDCYDPGGIPTGAGNCGIGAHEVEASEDIGITLWNDTCSSWEPRPEHYLARPPMPPEPTP